MSNHILVGLDIGSSTIKSLAVMPKKEDATFEILSQVSEPARGIRRGLITNTAEVSEVIASVLQKTQNECGKKIEDVFVNIGGCHIFSKNSRGTIIVSRADEKISEEDIERAIQAAQTFSLPANREILQVFPKGFIVDGETKIQQPLGLEGVRLEAEILVVGYFTPYFKNLTKAVLDAGYQISHIICNPIASASAVLTAQERELGTLLIDIGAGTTSFCVYQENTLMTVGIIPIGSFNITADIATGLATHIDTAEQIKLKFGICGSRAQKTIKIKEQESGEMLSFSQKKLNNIIEARVLEILQEIQKKVKSVGPFSFPGGVVLCGGGAYLPKIKDFSKKSLKMACRIGKPKGFFPKIDSPDLSCVAGLILDGQDFSEPSPPISRIFKTILEKIKKMLKDLIP